MSATKNNNIFDKTSFLGSNSSEFMEELYAQYVTNPQGLPEEWKEFFKNLNDDKEEVIKTVNGPSWSRKKRKERTTKNNFSCSFGAQRLCILHIFVQEI